MSRLQENIDRINDIMFLNEQGYTAQPDSTRVSIPHIPDRSEILKDKYSCTNTNKNPELSNAVSIAIDEEGLNPKIVKYGLGILGRESDFGDLGDYIPSRYAVKAGPEYIMNKIRASNDTIKDIFDWGASTVFQKDNWVPSMGIAQMTPDVAEKYGINLEQLMTVSGSLIAASHYLKDLYNELSNYDENKPSQVLRNGKLVTPEYSTGNGRLDAAIVSYNTGTKPYTKKYCKTDNPNLMAPCSEAGKEYKPSPNTNPDLVLKVTNEEIKNYLPNLKTGNLSSTGYLKEVTDRAKNWECIS